MARTATNSSPSRLLPAPPEPPPPKNLEPPGFTGAATTRASSPPSSPKEALEVDGDPLRDARAGVAESGHVRRGARCGHFPSLIGLQRIRTSKRQPLLLRLRLRGRLAARRDDPLEPHVRDQVPVVLREVH